MKREYWDYLEDISDSLNTIKDFTAGMTFEAFKQDRKTIFAVVRALEIIGEATKNLPPEVKNRFDAIPWKDMARMRDKLIHEYFGVDLDTVWKTVQEDVPAVRELLTKLMESLGEA